MKQIITTFMFILLLSMAGTKAWAYDFAVENADGVTIYYNYINDVKELEVTYRSSNYNSYTGSVVIPEEVTYMNRTRKVTSIGAWAFYDCRGLSSVTIPNSVTSIGLWAFCCCTCLTSITIPNSVTSIGGGAFMSCIGLTSITIPNSVTSIREQTFCGCTGLTSITIPNSVTSIGSYAFEYCDLPDVISKIENPFAIATNTFSKNTFLNATLFVPSGTLDKYKSTDGWKGFVFIEEGNGSGGGTETQKCEKPTISYQNGKLTFYSATEGVTFQSTISDTDIKSYNSSEIQLGVTYNISVYATKSGYENSETATATLCWIDVDPATEGITNGVANVPAHAVLIQSNGGVLTIQGADDGTAINVYGINGTEAGSAVSSNGSAIVSSNLQPGSIAIVKIGEKSVKVVVK